MMRTMEHRLSPSGLSLSAPVLVRNLCRRCWVGGLKD